MFKQSSQSSYKVKVNGSSSPTKNQDLLKSGDTMRMDNDDLIVDDSEMIVYKAKPKFQIDSLSNIIIARDVS